jgi:hypothetical protein
VHFSLYPRIANFPLVNTQLTAESVFNKNPTADLHYFAAILINGEAMINMLVLKNE